MPRQDRTSGYALARSATDVAPTSVWAWKRRAHYTSMCALMSVDLIRQEQCWDGAMVAVEALGKLAEREVYEDILVDTVAHASGLDGRYEDWAERHDVERLVVDLQHVRLADDATGRPCG